MDIFEFRSSRCIDLKGVFNDAADQQNNDLGGLFMRLKNLMVAEIHGNWDVAFLEKYLDDQMVPRSLRFEVSPHEDDTDIPGWYKYFNDVGLDLLRFLIGRKRRKLNKLDEEISEVKTKLIPYKELDEYRNKSDSLKKTLEKEDIDQKFKKKKKYSRDQEDYRTNQVFKWQIRRAAMANGNNESLNRPHVESTSMPVIPSHHAGNSRGSKPGNGWKKVGPRKGPKPRQPRTRTHDGREGHVQYNHPPRNNSAHFPTNNYYEPLNREYTDHYDGYDNRIIVDHPSQHTPRAGYYTRERSNWDSPGYYPPRNSQYPPRGPPPPLGPPSTPFFPKGSQKNKRDGEPKEGPEGGGGTERKRRRL